MCTSLISPLTAGSPASCWTLAICLSLRGSDIKLTVVWHFFDNWHLHRQVFHAHVHTRKLKCKVNKIIVACFFSKAYCKSLSLPLMTEILCAKPSNLIYISQMHAILLLLQGLYRMPCEWNHFIVKSWHSCRRITPLVTLGEHRYTPESAARPVPSEHSGLFSGNASATLQISASSERKPCSRLNSVIDLITFPPEPTGVFLSSAVAARLGPP